MIRPTTAADVPAVLALAVASGLFPPQGTDELAGVLTSSLDGSLGSDHCWVTDDDAGPVGVAYFAPERMTSGTWNLYMIAVHPDRQGKGRGAALVRHVEELLAARGERLLLVDTSSLPEFDGTRAFYRRCGYEPEARIRDFYKPGEDKITFRKVLPVSGA